MHIFMNNSSVEFSVSSDEGYVCTQWDPSSLTSLLVTSKQTRLNNPYWLLKNGADAIAKLHGYLYFTELSIHVY